MKREVQNVLLFLFGGAIVKISLDGSFVRYVKPSLHPYLLIAGVLIVVLAAASIVADIRRGGPTDGHDHDARPYWLLLVPIAVILLVAPPALGVSAVGDRSVDAVSTHEKTPFPPLPDGQAPDVPLLDVVQRAVRDSEDSLDGREISVTGFAVATANGGSPRVDGTTDGLDLARVLIICCAADARSIRIHLDSNSTALEDVPDGTWLQLTGTVDASTATEATAFTPTMTVSTARRIDPPTNTYAY
ncbi:TIGR03943 family protein [Rhodococcus fascians]|uniref:TIGR03943 family putative permease subunit n=1 Tax=Rhodococcoides fascians TaxID=1828 RepID=UPI000B9C11F3|nr:TIGR03943 family protein [Rhodococcus fascians]MBY4035640.1 TIGR03943 family protein [Rhodococcus fascians]MBY4138558.1 TIGR03943 family protein [Rhodococcus fascians]MBY4218202.1 TIGR03943 family protein [Rhodococcus fascians]MBY4221034.1 TIGR03943 family protein [Rhodococcus fascians]MBY4231194.1 TIGR03943 family protein [Rhodococcus fascians]